MVQVRQLPVAAGRQEPLFSYPPHLCDSSPCRCMYDSYLPQLAVCSEPDVAPTRTQLDHYYSNRQYLKEPEGRQMPNVDQSAYFVD